MKKNSLRSERNCNIIEFLYRRIVSALFYERIYRKAFPDSPYYTPAAIKKIALRINKSTKVFEWGSGLSTMWFARRVKELISVEHDNEWYEKGNRILEKEGINNLKLIFTPCNAKIDTPIHTIPEPKNLYSNSPFKDYISVIDNYPDSYFDCIAIDGRERIGCLVHALPKLSEKGFIVLDDSHRPRYSDFFNILSGWNIEKSDFGLRQTTIFSNKS